MKPASCLSLWRRPSIKEYLNVARANTPNIWIFGDLFAFSVLEAPVHWLRQITTEASRVAFIQVS